MNANFHNFFSLFFQKDDDDVRQGVSGGFHRFWCDSSGSCGHRWSSLTAYAQKNLHFLTFPVYTFLTVRQNNFGNEIPLTKGDRKFSNLVLDLNPKFTNS